MVRSCVPPQLVDALQEPHGGVRLDAHDGRKVPVAVGAREATVVIRGQDGGNGLVGPEKADVPKEFRVARARPERRVPEPRQGPGVDAIPRRCSKSEPSPTAPILALPERSTDGGWTT